MTREITHRELRHRSGAVVRALESGETFLLTRNGVAVGELRPLRQPRFVAAGVAVRAFSGSAPIDSARFRADIDRNLDHGPAPRA